MNEKQILILGVGNTLLADEGFGVRAVDYLQTHYDWPPNVNLVDGGTRGLMLMSELMEADFVAILDVVLGGQAPGTFYVLENDGLDKSLSFRESMHQTSVTDILICCDLAGHRPEALVFGFEPFDWQSPRTQLTAEAQTLLPSFCAHVAGELNKRGIVKGVEKKL